MGSAHQSGAKKGYGYSVMKLLCIEDILIAIIGIIYYKGWWWKYMVMMLFDTIIISMAQRIENSLRLHDTYMR